jgi:hypothetical protein
VTADLIAFLRARLAEDESVARAAYGVMWRDASGWLISEDMYIAEVDDGSTLAHIARHDPARTLREVEAKRRILDEHALNGWACSTCDNEDVEQSFPCPTLRLLASVWAGHPDYRPEWAS